MLSVSAMCQVCAVSDTHICLVDLLVAMLRDAMAVGGPETAHMEGGSKWWL